MNKEVGRRIRQARKEAGLTQAELGDSLGISGNAVTKLEGGHSALTIENLLGLYRVLHKPFGYFLGINDLYISGEEAEWLEIYRALPGRDRRYWVEALQAWLKRDEVEEIGD